MRVVNGKSIREIERDDVLAWAGRYREIVVDLGTGDGRFVRLLAQDCADRGVIGIDLVATNLRQTSRAVGENALFALADALALPDALCQIATQVTINFPWGSLLRGLLTGDPGLLSGLTMMGRRGASCDVLLNAGALAEAGWAFEAGGERVATVLRAGVANVCATSLLNAAEIRNWPTSWAKRLAFGRDPRALRIEARLNGAGPVRPEDVLHFSAGRRSAGLSICEPFCSVGRVSAQPHRRASGASPQEGGLVARSGTRPAKI